MTDLSKYKTDHLILLVGSNPLPNWVAGQLLWRKTKPDNRLFLVHSGDTFSVAERLRDLLCEQDSTLDRENHFRFIRVDEADAGNIQTELAKINNQAPSGDVGLNYTGGTKVMAVQAHKTIRDVVTGRRLVCSYLDARTYEMRFDPPDNVGNKKVLTDVNIKLEELLTLHDIELKPSLPNRKVVLPSAIQALAKIHTSKNAADNWAKWCRDEFGKARPELDNASIDSIDTILERYKKEEQTIEREAELAKISICWPLEKGALKPGVNKICEELGLDVTPEMKLSDAIGQHFSTMTDFCKWIKGVWLEHYTLSEIKKIAIDCNLCDYRMSLDTIEIKDKPKFKQTEGEEVAPNFEFDVAAIRGYQLFGLSCTTSIRNNMVKSKLFEAHIRARQLGGDEARVAVVCPHKKPNDIRKEVEFDAPGKVQVFGSAHLPKLADHLKKWFLGEK